MQKNISDLQNKKGRDSNIELLRIVAMFMIVVYHIVCHCVVVQLTDPASLGRTAIDTFNHPVFWKRLLLLNTIMSFGIIGNAVFLLISGYFMANRDASEIRLGKISGKLLLEQGFAAIILTCIPTMVHFLKPGLSMNLQSVTAFNSMSWFVGYYYIVVLCGALFLNKFLAGLDCKKYGVFVLALFAFVSFGWSGDLADGLAGGLRTLLTGIFLYSFGGFIRRFDPLKKIRIYVFFIVILVVNALIWISGYNNTMNNIHSYVQSHSADPFIQSVPGFDNFSVVVIVLAICMFEVFRRIHLPENKVIAFVGQATFMVYLIHDNQLFYSIWNWRDWITTLAQSPKMFLIQLLKWGGYSFAAGVIVYIAYKLLGLICKKAKFLITKPAG